MAAKYRDASGAGQSALLLFSGQCWVRLRASRCHRARRCCYGLPALGGERDGYGL